MQDNWTQSFCTGWTFLTFFEYARDFDILKVGVMLHTQALQQAHFAELFVGQVTHFVQWPRCNHFACPLLLQHVFQLPGYTRDKSKFSSDN